MHIIYKPLLPIMSWFLLLGPLLVSCMPDPLEVKDIPGVEHEIVVASQMLPDQGILIWLTKTFGALKVSEESNPAEVLKQVVVNEALVSIKGPGGIEYLTPLGNGVYGGYKLPYEEGETYELQVISESLGEVTATTTVQQQVSFESVDAYLTTDIYDDTLVNVDYSFQDPAEENWYMINVQKYKGRDFLQNIINPEYYTHLFKDTESNGQPNEAFDFYTDEYLPGDTIAVFLYNVNEVYYDFIKQRTENRYDFMEFLSEPINYPTNVVGGKGFFNLHVPDVKLFVLEMKE